MVLPPFVIYAVIYMFVKIKDMLGRVKNIGKSTKLE